METLSIGYLPESPEFFEYMTCRSIFDISQQRASIQETSKSGQRK